MAKNTTARSEFASAVNQIAHERSLDPNVILDAIRQAIVVAFKKDHPGEFQEDHYYDVELDSGTGEAKVLATPGQIEDVDGTPVVHALPGASPSNVTPPGFGRIAAQTAKQVIVQKIREAEKANIISEYEKRIDSLVGGMIIRFVGSDIIVDIGKAEAVLPREEQIPSENYNPNQRLTFYLSGVREGTRGKEVVVSRTQPGLIRELFRREVPEVNSGNVEIKAIARDPGSRTKIAVYSHQTGVDPVGSCVGQKGVRVQAVIGELNGEKIDIVQYSDDPEKFTASALSPAGGLSVQIDEKKKTAQVTAPADQLSLAIGRDGQNAKLAGKLTGYHIDIKASDQPLPKEKGTSEMKEDSVSQDQIATISDQ